MATVIQKVRKIRVVKHREYDENAPRCYICQNADPQQLGSGYADKDGKRIKVIICKDYMLCINLLRF